MVLGQCRGHLIHPPPLAVVIAGGVGFSIILSLLFTPAVYHLCYGGRADKVPLTQRLSVVSGN
jgi:multidrug efflux pump subunit AcrB